MVMLCFVLDLRSLSPALLGDLKQLLLQLANFYAISPSLCQSSSLSDRIGLCYLFNKRISSSDELKIAYRPSGNFSLRDFHHAVNNLPTDEFLPEIKDSGAICCRDVKLSIVLSDQVLYSWGDKDIMRKVIVLSSCLPENVDSALEKTLMDAADKCVTVEFVLFEQKSSHLGDMQEHINNFLRCVSDLDNCSFQTYLPDVKVFRGMVKRWLQDLKDDTEEPLQARFVFKNNLFGSVNQIYCNLCASVNQIIDEFSPCQKYHLKLENPNLRRLSKPIMCHGIQLGSMVKDGIKGPSCPVTGHGLGKFDVIENSMKVGENTILFMPSFQSSMKLQQVSLPIDFKIVEKTPLGSLDEGVIIGASYVVTPSACHEMETASGEIDHSELNAQRAWKPSFDFLVCLFQGLCNALHSLDLGLICCSYFNMQSMTKASFYCYYILQPSDNGPMLLRRLAGSEEVLPAPDVNRFIDSSVPKEIELSIQTCLLKIESRDYNPLLYERGFHQKLNTLVKESLQFGSVPPKLHETTLELIETPTDSSVVKEKLNSDVDAIVVREEPMIDLTTGEVKTGTSITEEWEQLVVSEIPEKYSPTCITKPKFSQSVLSPPDINRQPDEKTSRILERLEVPRKLKTKAVSPISTSSSISDTGVTMKKPLIPFQPSQSTDQGMTSSQLMKPNFQRLKRKHK